VSVAAPTRETTEQPEPGPERRAPGLIDSPQWITPAEAAFLATVDEARIRSWIDAGLLEAVSMFRKDHDPSLVLVNARDLAWARDREDQPEVVGSPAIAVPAAGERSRTRRYVEAGLTIALLLVWLNAIRPSFVAEPNSGDRAGAPASPPPVGAGTAIPPDLVPSTILVRWIGFARDGDRIDLAATVANPDPKRWILPGDAAFMLHDASGAVLTTIPVSLSIGPGGTRTVMVNGADLGDVSPRSVASIHLVPLVPPQPASLYEPPSIKLSHVRLERTRRGDWAVGRVTSRGSSRGSPPIQCALIDRSRNLIAVESAEPIRVRAGQTMPFAVRLRDVPVHGGRVACSIAT
jgi:hypothetical protein